MFQLVRFPYAVREIPLLPGCAALKYFYCYSWEHTKIFVNTAGISSFPLFYFFFVYIFVKRVNISFHGAFRKWLVWKNVVTTVHQAVVPDIHRPYWGCLVKL